MLQDVTNASDLLTEHIDAEEQTYRVELATAKQVAEANANSFARFLIVKYKLQEGDSIQADGTIIRHQE